MMMNFLSSLRLGQAVSIILALLLSISAADESARATLSKGGYETWAEYHAATMKETNYNEPVSRPKPKPVDEDISPQNTVQSRPSSSSMSTTLSEGSYALQVKTFHIALLSTNFPYKMKARRPKDITNFVETFLEEQWEVINNDDDKNSKQNNGGARSTTAITSSNRSSTTTPKFQLNCNKSKSKMGNDNRWVITCDDNMAIFTKTHPQFVDSFISDVLTNKDTMEEFLERMYPRYHKGKQQMQKTEEEEEMQQKDDDKNNKNAFVRSYSLEEEEKKIVIVEEEELISSSSQEQGNEEEEDGGDDYPTLDSNNGDNNAKETRRQRRRNDMEQEEEEEDLVVEEGDDGGTTRMLRGRR